MKTLILSDENYSRLIQVLHDDERGLEVVRAMTQQVELPSDRELRLMARGDERPAVVSRAVAYRDAGRQAQTDTREAAEDLMRRVYEAGVGPAALARWFELAPSRVYEVLGELVG